MPILASSTAGSPHVTNCIAQISTFLTAHGWSLFDTVSATDLVFKSTGTGRERIFVRLTKSTNRILIRAYAFWDAGSNTGFNKAGADTDGVDGDDGSAFAFWCWTDTRAIVIVCKVGSTYNGGMAGALDRVADGSIGITQNDESAGAGVLVELNQSFPTNPDWQVGKKLMVIDQDAALAAAGAVPTEFATVTAVSVGTVSLDLAVAHKLGALVGVDPQPVFTAGLNDIPSSPRMTNDPLGWSTATGRLYTATLPFSDVPTAELSDRTSRHLEVPIYLANTTASVKEVRGKLPGILAFPNGGSGLGAEDTSDIGGNEYIAFPIGTSGTFIMVPNW